MLNYGHDKAMQNQILLTLLDHQFNKKLETLSNAAREDRNSYLARMEDIKKELVDKFEIYLNRNKIGGDQVETENLVSKIRLEINNLETKIENNFKDLMINVGGGKKDQSALTFFNKNNENLFKTKSLVETVLITPDKKCCIIPNRNKLQQQKHVTVQNHFCKINRESDVLINDGQRNTLNKSKSRALPRCTYLQG